MISSISYMISCMISYIKNYDIAYDIIYDGNFRGLMQVGVNVASSRKKKALWVSPRGGPAGPGRPSGDYIFVHFVFAFITSNSRLAENYPLCHAGLSYCCCFPDSDRNSHCYSFLSPTFELASPAFPHLHPAILLLSYPFLASVWLQKVRPLFIFGYSMRTGSWSAAFDFKRSGPQSW